MLAHLIALFYFMRHVCYRYITLNSSQRTCNELTLFHVSAQIWFIVFSFSFWFNRVTKNRFQNILSLLLLLCEFHNAQFSYKKMINEFVYKSSSSLIVLSLLHSKLATRNFVSIFENRQLLRKQWIINQLSFPLKVIQSTQNTMLWRNVIFQNANDH